MHLKDKISGGMKNIKKNYDIDHFLYTYKL